MPAQNPYQNLPAAAQSPAASMVAITKADADLPTVIRQLYVGTGGDVSLTDTAGNTVPHKNVPSGSYLGPFFVTRVNATGTTAADMVGYV